ncbi:MAG: hypothetical protein IPO14_02650 [Saprospiraceae bacterium]|nr:hypothetical protein [Saprospiraceae bacterium]
MNFLKKIIPVLILVLGLGAWYGYKEYNRGHEDLTSASSEVFIDAKDLFDQFTTDEAGSNAKYLDKIITVKGTIAAIEKDEKGLITFLLDVKNDMANVTCQMDEKKMEQALKFKVGDNIQIKGQCSGFLMDVVLIRCVIEN